MRVVGVFVLFQRDGWTGGGVVLQKFPGGMRQNRTLALIWRKRYERDLVCIIFGNVVETEEMTGRDPYVNENIPGICIMCGDSPEFW